ncbi:VIT1/CCC1 transporter family protein [Thalassospira lucentensis]|uniref:VIT1/CCC1 transporter family protein n=1 Tax=Thalassospira lucentensis TaxID=168935 RepID=UPI003D2EAFB6
MEHHRKVKHHVNRVGWLRAAIMGANDGIVSTASLLVGVTAASVGRDDILLAGIAGLVAGAMSMAAGEYVSVSSQSDTEKADLAAEKREQAEDPIGERAELAEIYRDRGLEPVLADEVAAQLMERDALGAHARDELGISEVMVARPIQAAFTSAATFSLGAFLPLIMVLLAPDNLIIPAVSVAALIALAILGAFGAKAGGADMLRASLRVTFWGALAMVLTAMIGKLFGTVV